MKTIITAFVAFGLIALMTTSVLATAPIGIRKGEEFGKVESREYKIEVSEDASNTYPTVIQADETGIIEKYPDYSKVKVSIEPSKQKTNDGTASYKIIVQDFHPMQKYPCADGEICVRPQGEKPHTYELSFYSEQGLKGKLEVEEVSLGAGQSESIELKVRTEEKGSYVFQVAVEGEDAKDVARGLLIYGNEEEPPVSASFFVGEGFALNEDETQGMPVKLNILKKDEALGGKINLGKRNLKIEGTVSDSDIKFKIFSSDQNEEIGTFVGTIKKFDTFLLLRGELGINDGETWTLTAIGKKENVFHEIQMEKVEIGESHPIQNVKVKEVIAIRKSTPPTDITEEAEDEFYVRPVKIEKEKILKVIPNPWGKKVLEVEVIEGSKTTTKTIKAFESTKIKNYELSVGSLDNEENLEISVAQTS